MNRKELLATATARICNLRRYDDVNGVGDGAYDIDEVDDIDIGPQCVDVGSVGLF